MEEYPITYEPSIFEGNEPWPVYRRNAWTVNEEGCRTYCAPTQDGEVIIDVWPLDDNMWQMRTELIVNGVFHGLSVPVPVATTVNDAKAAGELELARIVERFNLKRKLD